MALQEKTLGQLRPSDTNAVSIYSPGVGVTAIIKTILIVNTSGAAASARLFLDDDGATYDESTTIGWDVPISTFRPEPLTMFLGMDNFSGNLAVRSSVANALTFTVSGAEST